MNSEVLEYAWKRQKEWSETANKTKADYEFWRKMVFSLAVIAAISAALSTTFPGAISKLFAMIAAICAAISPVISGQKAGKQQLQNWTRARSVSEALKSSIFKYLVSTRSDRLDELNRCQEEILESVPDLVRVSIKDGSVSATKLKDMSIVEYIDARVLDQAEKYYHRTARAYSSRVSFLQKCYLVLMIAAAVISTASAFFHADKTAPWVAVLTTIGASVLAYLAAGRYESLSLSYQATGDRLINLKNRWLALSDEEKIMPSNIENLVQDCESVISNQNQSWHAKVTTLAP